jgi:hypothetical protein
MLLPAIASGTQENLKPIRDTSYTLSLRLSRPHTSTHTASASGSHSHPNKMQPPAHSEYPLNRIEGAIMMALR